MGTDCYAIAKKKDGTYVQRSLDRAYVFNRDLFEVPSIYDKHRANLVFDDAIFKNSMYTFPLQHGIDWCEQRLCALKGKTETDFNNQCAHGPYGHVYHVQQAKEFFELILNEELYWVAILDEHDHFDLVFYDKIEPITIGIL